MKGLMKMEDSRIIYFYFKRSEKAIEESKNKYGRYCSAIADNILHDDRDTEECVNDTWLNAWNSIPPSKPKKLSAFLGSITRNLAFDRYRKAHSGRRGKGEIAVCLDELKECVGDREDFTDILPLKEALNSFMAELTPQAREIFLLRYWYTYSVKEIVEKLGSTEGTVKSSLYRTRCALRIFLENEGFDI